jgi:hypothetical protein
MRGEHIGFLKRILLWLGFPVKWRAMQSDDVYYIQGRSISYPQAFSDVELQRRVAMQQEQQAANAKRNPKPGPAPKAIVPKGK